MKNYKIAKIMDCTCKRCQRMFNIAEAFAMPDEMMKWNCTNCGNEYQVFVSHNDIDGMTINVYSSDRKGGNIRHKFNFDDNKNTFRRMM